MSHVEQILNENGHTSTRVPYSDGARIVRDKNQQLSDQKILAFFITLQDEKTTPDFTKFTDHWLNINEAHHSSEGLALIIHHTAKALKHKRYDTQRVNYQNFIRQNIQNWEKPILKTMHDLSTQGLSNSLIALTKLDIKPSFKFLRTWNAQALLYMNSTTPKDHFNPQDLALSLNAYSKITDAPPTEFMQACQNRAIKCMKSAKH